ncbi:MAG TPA: hypothetical protein VJY35_09940 [Candidatus Eisenbacteria bacterium]|nr:hypothetical protein [Candidatus Eisenbacteria bacterium]
MHWFREIASDDLAVAAVTCLSAPAVWAAFWFDHVHARRRRQLVKLVRLRRQLRLHVEPWANEWPEESFSADWYLPGWHAKPVRGEPHIERFNQLVMKGDFPQALTKGLARLESAVRRFREALTRQDELRRNMTGRVKENLQPAYAEAKKRPAGPLLSDEELKRLASGMHDEDRRWVQDYFQGNRRLHVEAIGRRGGHGLYEAWRSVIEEMDTVQAAIQEGDNPWWVRVGHALAFVLALMGALFVVNFWASFLENDFHRTTTSPADSTRAHAGTTATAGYDTSGSHLGALSDSGPGSR